jgi:D-lactate dehydrogenase (cytochrome)
MFNRVRLIKLKPYARVRTYSTSANRARYLNYALGGALIGTVAYTLETESLYRRQSINTDSTLPLKNLPSPQYGSDEELNKAIGEIRGMFLQNTPEVIVDTKLVIDNTKETLDNHSDTYFNSHHATPDQRPKYVVFPRSTQEVSNIMKVCHKFKIPVVPTSGRSSLEGHFIPTRGGICIDISTMDSIVKLNQTDLDITVQGGVGWETLADYLDDYHLLYAIDPGPGATISGCLANNASGTNASRYGEAYKNVLNLTVVLADGTIVKTKQRPRKSSAGYNLNSLFVGSEGTLGIITEATLKLHVKPAEESVVVVPFPSISDAADAVNSILLKGIQLGAIELLDDKMMRVINASGETTRKWHENPTLFLRLGGSNKEVVDVLNKQVKSIVKDHHSIDYQYASTADDKTELWSARKVALWSTINQGKQVHPDVQLWTTDAAVPISKLPQFLSETKADIDSHGLTNTLVAHIGDGNAHSFILYRPEQRDVAETVVNNMVQRAINYEGTCTGEHGIGLGKREFLLEEVGEVPVDVMRKIKLALDPLRIMNPDKVFKIDVNDNNH